MGTLISILAGLYFLAGLVRTLVKKKPPTPGYETGEDFRSKLERNLRDFTDKTEWLFTEDEDEKKAKAKEKMKAEKKAEKKRIKKLRKSVPGIEGFDHPELEGTGLAFAPSVDPKEGETAVELRILQEEERGSAMHFFPEEQKAKRELLKKGIVLKEILEPKYF